MVCDFGSVFSMFGPQMIACLESWLQWVDPCGDVSNVGLCDGNVARNCETNFNGNIRRLAEEDCSVSGLACVTGETGAGCGAPPEPGPVEQPDPQAPESCSKRRAKQRALPCRASSVVSAVGAPGKTEQALV